MRLSLRTLLACAAAWAVLAYGATGHGIPKLDAHDGMAGATMGLCLLLVTVVALTRLQRPRPGPRRSPVRTNGAAPEPAVIRAIDARERASPSVLQRFRN